MVPVAAIDWVEARRLYEETELSLKQICARCGISLSQLRWRRTKEQWPPRNGRIREAGEEPDQEGSSSVASGSDRKRATSVSAQAVTALSVKRRRRPSLKERRQLLYRLYEAIVTKVAQLEERSLADGPPTISDYERETRVLATMIRNFERVMEAEAEIERSGKSNKTPTAAADLVADAERWRNEVAERLARLRNEHQRE